MIDFYVFWFGLSILALVLPVRIAGAGLPDLRRVDLLADQRRYDGKARTRRWFGWFVVGLAVFYVYRSVATSGDASLNLKGG